MHALLRILLSLLALALCIATLIPLIRTNAWWVRVFDFPRVQIVVLMLVVFLAMGAVALWSHRRKKPEASRRTKLWSRAYALVPILLLAALAWQLFRIHPYTALAAHQMEDATFESDAARQEADTVRLLIYNVRYDNRAVAELLETIDDTDPHVILLVEPTNWWHEQLAPLEADYPHTIFQPQDNHYGVLLYSKLELIDPSVRFLVDDEVPSIHARLRLPSGRVATLYGLHPKPPGLKRPADPDRQDSDQRDAELLIVAKEVADLVKNAAEGVDTPVIVAGDFNDVAWSHTTRLFQRLSGLLDPRIGRGLHNTYDAKSRVLRFPLDHVFASEHFRLIALDVLPPMGSDHHAVLVELALEPTAEATQKEPNENEGDSEEADEIIEEGHESQDEPG
jgi:endonuclease/exonuclease/phosphatase (EEP) superfamily protein YafD